MEDEAGALLGVADMLSIVKGPAEAIKAAREARVLNQKTGDKAGADTAKETANTTTLFFVLLFLLVLIPRSIDK